MSQSTITTLNLDIHNKQSISAQTQPYPIQYSACFINLYANNDLIKNKDFEHTSLSFYPLLDASFFEYCRQDVEDEIKQVKAIKAEKQKEIDKLEEMVLKNNFKDSNEKYYLSSELFHLKDSINRDVTFGGKNLLIKITKAHNNFNKLNQTKEEKERIQELINQYTKEYQEIRIRPIYSVGMACEHGNRKFKFDFLNSKILFKPNRNVEIEILLGRMSKKRKKELQKLQAMVDNNLIAITVRMGSEHICLSYDKQLVNGYSFNKSRCKEEQSKKKTKEEKKLVYKKWVEEQEVRMMIGKLSNRTIAIDLNPNYIGVSVIDFFKHSSGKIRKILHAETIDLSELNKHSGEASDHSSSIYINNKRDFEIKQIYKYIFDCLATHYRVGMFSMEDLDFKGEYEYKGRKFNYETKNIWCRGLQEELIDRHCSEKGIRLRKINPIYSSFVGNILHGYHDPVNASIEIARRGHLQFIKGTKHSYFPPMGRINSTTLTDVLDENVFIAGNTAKNWKELFLLCKDAGLRYRRPLDLTVKSINLFSYKSAVKRFKFA